MRASRGRKPGIGALLVVATIVAILGMTAVWVQRQILDRDEWVETSVDLLEDEHIRQAVGLYLIDELYAKVCGSCSTTRRPAATASWSST